MGVRRRRSSVGWDGGGYWIGLDEAAVLGDIFRVPLRHYPCCRLFHVSIGKTIQSQSFRRDCLDLNREARRRKRSRGIVRASCHSSPHHRPFQLLQYQNPPPGSHLSTKEINPSKKNIHTIIHSDDRYKYNIQKITTKPSRQNPPPKKIPKHSETNKFRSGFVHSCLFLLRVYRDDSTV